jgi:hypothetical protein
MNDFEQLPRFAQRQRACRLIHDENARVEGKRLGDLHQLLLGESKLVELGIDRNREAQTLQENQCIVTHLGAVNQAE